MPLPTIGRMRNRSGLEVLAIQHAVANASPGAWRDAVVVDGGIGTLTLMCMDGEAMQLATSAEVAPGEPVAFHPVAEVLAASGERTRARAI
jgi:hypothetical protein